ncbi:MAG: hypothetical protein AAF656_11365, partial [Planctomycetota bacterium]
CVMLEIINEGITRVQQLPEGDQGPLTVWLYGWVVVNVIYYLVLGTVVIWLGIRIVNAMTSALREANRVAAQTPNA